MIARRRTTAYVRGDSYLQRPLERFLTEYRKLSSYRPFVVVRLVTWPLNNNEAGDLTAFVVPIKSF